MVILDPEKDLMLDHFNNDVLTVDQNQNVTSAEFYCTCSPSPRLYGFNRCYAWLQVGSVYFVPLYQFVGLRPT